MGWLERSFAAVGWWCRDGDPGWTWRRFWWRLAVVFLAVATFATVAGLLGDGPTP